MLSTAARLLAIAAMTLAGPASAAGSLVQIPSIGCPTGGQENTPAPPDGIKSISLDPRVAPRLALYGDTVLGPRGWHCRKYTTDEGYLTLVTPRAEADLNLDKGVPGPAILVFALDSGAFGRFEVAEIIARYFPARWDYTRKIMQEEILPRRMVFHPWRADRFLARGGRMFELETPPRRRGFGTQWFGSDRLSVRSRVFFFDADDPGFLILQVKLPLAGRDLIPVILDQART